MKRDVRGIMATITTRGEQEHVAQLKDRVGGYAELIRLLEEQRTAGPNAELRREANGRLTYMPRGPRRAVGQR